jgi:hypothetical protein
MDRTEEQIPKRSGRRPRRRARLSAVATIAVVVVAGAAVVACDGQDTPSAEAAGGSLDEVGFDLHWPDLQGLEGSACIDAAVLYTAAQHGDCFRQLTGEVELAGDVAGTGLWMMLGNVGRAADAEDSAVDVPATFTSTYLIRATVEGCGMGEFMIAEQLRFDGWESGAFSGTWQIVPGSGRGDLSTISGSGEVPGDDTDHGTDQATRRGEIGCD